jgi:transposase-like protein
MTISFARHQFPPAGIRHAVWLHIRFTLSYRDIEDLLAELKLDDWAFAIAKRSTMRTARVALARRLAIIMHAMLRDGTEFAFA